MIFKIPGIYQSVIFYLSFKNNNARTQLQKLSVDQRVSSEQACFYYYQLGMFLSVTVNTYRGNGWRGNFAKAIALAATGNFKEAEEKITLLCNTLKVNKYLKLQLAMALAPYMPARSLELLEDNNSQAAKKFKLALLLSLGKEKAAKNILRKLKKLEPDIYWYLLYFSQDMQSRLELLNNCLLNYNLEPVALFCDKKQLNPLNIYCDLDDKIAFGPLVSILVTTYCNEMFVEKTLLSLLSQTYENIEVIVVDDASTDNTSIIVQEIMKKDTRVRLLKMDSNSGTFVAKTKGLKYSRGEFITCHDSDDWAHPRKIELQIKPLLEDAKLSCTFSQWTRITMDGKPYARQIYPLMRLNPSSPLFRKKIVLEHVGVWDQVRTGADSEFFNRIKLVLGRDSIQYIKKPLTIGLHRSNSLMTNPDTGYNSKGISVARIEYVEKWMTKHINNETKNIKKVI